MPDIKGVFKVFNGEDNQIKVSELRGAALISLGIGAVAGGIIARKRANEGKEPALGFLF